MPAVSVGRVAQLVVVGNHKGVNLFKYVQKPPFFYQVTNRYEIGTYSE